MPNGTFATAITCIDGRVQQPVAAWCRDAWRVDFVDMVTEPGPERQLAQAWMKLLDLKMRAELSAKAHGSRAVAIAGHAGCAANLAAKADQWRQIEKAIEVVRSWHLFPTIAGLWVNEELRVEVVNTFEEPEAR